MKKHILSVSLLTVFTLFASGCGTSTASKFAEFSNMLADAMPYVNESEEWDAYSIKTAQQGVVYSPASTADIQYVSNRMDAEYAAAIDRVVGPFARNDKTKKELAEANQNYHFNYNKVIIAKDKSTANLIGYCVNYDRLGNGKGQTKEEDKLYKDFIFVTKDKPISMATTNSDFIKRVCGNDFYNKYKKPNA